MSPGWSVHSPDGGIPFLEKSQQGAGGVERLAGTGGSQDEAGEMSAVGVAQALRLAIIDCEEE